MLRCCREILIFMLSLIKISQVKSMLALRNTYEKSKIVKLKQKDTKAAYKFFYGRKGVIFMEKNTKTRFILS